MSILAPDSNADGDAFQACGLWMRLPWYLAQHCFSSLLDELESVYLFFPRVLYKSDIVCH